MLVINGVVKDARAHERLRRQVQACVRRAAARGIEFPHHIHAEFVNRVEGEGGVEGNEFFLTVPYEVAQHTLALKWYVAHELVHVWQAFIGQRGRLRHDGEFYDVLKAICAPTALSYELRYRPKAARRHGITRKLRKR